ncbi:MAG: DNA adenine methylase [Spirochaetales bacterium]|jgi:adenine-specific DNA-methyltransferase|nr:DNA adenine methylase [Spirochaetales bacterium]
MPARAQPPALQEEEALHEKKEYLTRQLITYIGNKRALLNFIGNGVKKVQDKLRKEKLTAFDVFSGSGIVARYFKQFSRVLIANDLEKYSTVINECYLSNENSVDIKTLKEQYRRILRGLSHERLEKGIIASLYAPQKDADIQSSERVFYTARNAMYIDTARKLIEELPPHDRKFFLAPLLSEASIHANTSGVFKGFYKNRETGTGQFGGKNEDALLRIKGDITLHFPVFSNFSCDAIVLNEDANEVIRNVPEVDIAYIDPPYNQHPYGSNYFMLNLILDYRLPENVSRISGIPPDWKRSRYNKANLAYRALKDLMENIKAKFILLSFNSEGFIDAREMKEMLSRIGKLEVLETRYNAFRGSRNLKAREIHVKEYLYLLEK